MAGTSLFYQVLEIAKKEKAYKEQTIKDLIALVKNELARNREKGLIFGKHLRIFFDDCINEKDRINKQFIYNSLFTLLVAESPYSLDSYFQALEWQRPVEESFWLPRREKLMSVVEEIEKLLITDDLDELFISMPPRVGKSTLALFVYTWIIGTNSELHNLYASCSGQLTNAFYKGIYEILTDETTYCWKKIFPNVKFDPNVFVSAKECFLDTGRVKRYHSFTGRSIDSESLNGSCDCNGVLCGDDLCSGIEEALNKERLGMLNMKVNNNLLTRAKMGCKIMWIGTRWSIADPIQVRLDSLDGTTIRHKVINRPALDPETDESNFDYKYGVGFSTEYYRNKRASFINNGDEASWLAQFMGQPIERSGLLFPIEDLMTYTELPAEMPDRIYGFCDIAWGGGDFTCLPCIYQYGDICYCPEMVCDSGDKVATVPKVVDLISRHRMVQVRFEKNSGGEQYKEAVEKELARRGISLNIETKRAFSVQKKYANSKEQHIFEKAPDIRQIRFLDRKMWNEDYRKAMQMLTTYMVNGKNKHDDSPDALAGSMDIKDEVKKTTAMRIVSRLF